MAADAAGNRPPTAIRVLALAAIAALWLGLMTWRLPDRTLHVDEFITCYRVAGDAPLFDAMHPQSYYAYVRAWTGLFGSSDTSLRMSGLPLAAAAVACVAVVAWWLMPWPGPLVALGLVCLSSELLLYWRMARYFAPVAGAFGLVMLAAVGFLRSRRPGWLALMAAATVLCAYLDYLPTVVALLPWAWVIASALRRRERGKAAIAALALAAAGLAMLPSIRWALDGARHVTGRGFGFSLKNLVLKGGIALWGLLAGEALPPWQTLAAGLAVVGAAVLAVAGAWAAWRKGGPWRLLLLSWPAAVAVASVALDLTPHEPPVRITSLALQALPWALVVLALGWTERRDRPWAHLALAAVLLGQACGMVNYFGRRNLLNPQYALSWREVGSLLQERVGPEDAVVTFFDAGLYRYYRPPVRVEALQLQARGPGPLTDRLRRGGRLWLVTRDRGSTAARQLAAGFRDAFRAMGATERAHGFLPYAPQEREWRKALTRSAGADNYITVYEMWLPPRPARPAGEHGSPAPQRDGGPAKAGL